MGMGNSFGPEFFSVAARMIQDGRAWLLDRTSERVSVVLLVVDGERIKIVWDGERKSVASLLVVSESDLSACDCGHRHCRSQHCAAFVVGDVEPRHCRCDHKCACGLCLRLGEALTE